jgi:hypothetical protein
MNAHYNRSWILILVFVCVTLCTPMSGHAFVLGLGGSLHEPAAVRSSAADVLYATDRDGHEVKLVGTDSLLLEGTPLDIGIPSVAPDGTVFFGAAFRRNDRVRWEIFAANPDEHRLSRVPLSTPTSVLEMIVDPTPLAQSDGSIVFAARDISRGEGLYQLKNSKVSCLVRVGTELDGNHVIRNIGFGSFSAASGGAVAFTGHITRVGKAELLVANGKVTVIAAVGGKAPEGARYRDLGSPTVRGENVAFPALTDRGSSVYAYSRGKVGMVLTSGSPCTGGKITYISQDRLGLGSDGTVVVGAICSGSPAIFLVRRSEATMLASATREPDRTGFVDLDMPSLLETGTVLFSARRGDGTGLYSIHLNFGSPVTGGAALPLIAAADPTAPPLHSILTVSLASNEQGRLAYLGGPVESLASVPSE